MNRIFKLFILSTFAFVAFSCEDYLDINENPNQATSSSPQQVLPNALTVTAANVVTFNDYGSWHVGYIVNAGGFGGWNTEFTYAYTNTNYNAVWTSTYDNLNDYQYIDNASKGNGQLAYYNAIAKIMKAYNFQMLVDAYGDVPYTEALQGSNNVTPGYDSAESIYQDLVVQLDSALYIIDNAEAANTIASGDVMFNGNMTRWARFANALKLRVLLRASKAPGAGNQAAWVTSGLASFAADTEFLVDDAIVNPGYQANAGKQNPYWERYHTTAAGATTANGRSRITSVYALSFYNGTKLEDPARGAATYRSFPSTAANQLGDISDGIPTAPNSSIAWYVGTGTGANAENTIGLFKGRTMGQPIMLASESDFLVAEARARGFLQGDAKAAFNKGIENSFRYLYKGVNNSVVAGYDPVADALAYMEANEGDYLVDFDEATSVEQRVEAIITQKYIALNFIHGHEAWSEFRRTGYPRVSGTAATSTFVSLGSTSPRSDRLPVRIIYPATEFSLNPNSVPTGVNHFTTNFFWDLD